MKHAMLAGSVSALAIAAARPLPSGLIAARIRADADPAKVLADLQKAWADMQAGLDEKIKAKADVLIDEKIERVNTAVLQTCRPPWTRSTPAWPLPP
jgi:hypothetical protein